MIKKTVLFIFATLAGHFIQAEEFSRELSSFSRVIASPRINLILKEGSSESIHIVYNNITPDRINIDVSGRTLRIFLDQARVTEKLERRGSGTKVSIYEDATVTAYVTYRFLRHLEIRGNQELTCESPLTGDKLVLKAYGGNEINLASVETGYFKTHLYGENRLKVKGGRTDFQKYKLYGENRIDTRALKSYTTATTTFGESRIRLSSQDELRVSAFGESEVSFNGTATINRGLIFGNTDIRREEE